MKRSSTFKLILFGFLCAFMASSCVKEGPMGPAGADGQDGTDGTNGVDGNVTCMVCHSSDNILAKKSQYVLSGHAVGEFTLEREEWSSSCVRCHTPVGFQQFAELGEDAIIPAGIENTETFDCSTCHGIHQTFEGIDYALRITDPVEAIFSNVTFDLGGNSNLCGNCHQTRRAGPSVTNPTDTTFYISSTHWGPHHGPQGNVVAGNGFEEIEGSISYPTSDHPHLTMASCTGCHMPDFDDAEVQGGHSFIPSTQACNDCHSGEDLDGSYDYKATQTLIEDKLIELRDLLVAANVMAGNDTDGYHVIDKVTYPAIYASAYFNWIGLEEDRSLGVHNPEYVKALLINTIEAVEAESN